MGLMKETKNFVKLYKEVLIADKIGLDGGNLSWMFL